MGFTWGTRAPKSLRHVWSETKASLPMFPSSLLSVLLPLASCELLGC